MGGGRISKMGNFTQKLFICLFVFIFFLFFLPFSGRKTGIVETQDTHVQKSGVTCMNGQVPKWFSFFVSVCVVCPFAKADHPPLPLLLFFFVFSFNIFSCTHFYFFFLSTFSFSRLSQSRCLDILSESCATTIFIDVVVCCCC